MLGACVRRLARSSLKADGVLRGYHNGVITSSSKCQASKNYASEKAATDVCQEVASINTRLGNLSLTAAYLTGPGILSTASAQPLQNQVLHLPTPSAREIEAPSSEVVKQKVFIQETKAEIKEPEVKKRIDEPITKRISKYAIRMVLVRKKKMKKHRKKRLWDRMYLKFNADRTQHQKRTEIEFRGRLNKKIQEARKFDAKKYVDEYLNDLHTPLIPGTYKGKRLPQWLIIELMEDDKLKEQEAKMENKTFTTKETILREGETVQEFINRTWK
eukprot:TRINITY_DN6616_c0_g1_i1.p1 TRINITY_DN6616_c0_g1~~TRINITY_DN6616_c0_g1_i1.p1  ORF type:complete len:273 (+),score=43.92 TRINITY_DN6616_c0_g1_i1:36-854(+)